MHSRNRWAVLAVVCASVYLINLDMTIVNAALPTLVRELHAGTRDLQWIVDAYNLTFAAFVLAAGSLSDRYGRRAALLTGLAIFGTLVYTIIEAPARSWGAPVTLAGFALAAVLLLAFVRWERRQAAPMIDVRLFRDLRFSAACGAVTVAWFCLFGFIFLITQYFQFLKGYGPLTFGGALMPVAGAIALGAVTGVLLSVRVGNRAVVATGLGLMGVFFLWVSTVSAGTPYWPEIVGQTIAMGLGLVLTTVPATEAIMVVAPIDKPGVGSAVNDATRELGGTLGVAIIGSASASIYTRSLGSATLAGLPAEATEAART